MWSNASEFPSGLYGSCVRKLVESWLDPTEVEPEKPEERPNLFAGYESYEEWLQALFPDIAHAPMAERHHRAWRWFESLELNAPPPLPIVEIWGRGGAKSMTLQLGVAYTGARLARQFVLYVSETQDQANEHVQTIADLLEEIGVAKAVGAFGNQKGWRKGQLRTAHGFNVMPFGLDTAARGIKLGKFRPDLMIFDDIDGSEDTAKTTAKKIRSITKKLLPAGAANCAIAFAQNLVCEDGVVAQLYDGRADFLQSRVCNLDVAVRGLETESRIDEDGRTRHYIVKGEATWEGQNLEICQRQIHEWGITSFREEAQHEVQGVRGYFFDEKQFVIVDEIDASSIVRVVRAWDLAATQGAGDFTVGVLMGITANGVIWILDVVRAQLSPDNADRLQKMVTEWDRSVWGSKYRVREPQDPGSAGKKVAEASRKEHGSVIQAVTGRKASRWRRYAAAVNEGNARMLKDGRERTPQIDNFLADMVRRTELEGKAKHWNQPFLAEHRKAQEDESHDFDDQIDAGADAFNDLAVPSKKRVLTFL